MPTESKSETPRTDAELKSYRSKNWKDKSPQEMLCLFARQLEKELNEAKRELSRRIYYQDIVYNVCNQLDSALGRHVTKGTGIVCGTISEPSTEVQECLGKIIEERNTLAKQNHQLRAGAEKLLLEISPRSFTSEQEYEAVNKFLKQLLYQPTPTNLIVLTRDELIAEIEKMVCMCSSENFTCEKHQWLARVKEQL